MSHLEQYHPMTLGVLLKLRNMTPAKNHESNSTETVFDSTELRQHIIIQPCSIQREPTSPTPGQVSPAQFNQNNV